MNIHQLLRKGHRIGAGLFLLAVIPAAVVSFQGNAESLWVYAPLPFLFALMISGTYLLVRPWVVSYRARRAKSS